MLKKIYNKGVLLLLLVIPLTIPLNSCNNQCKLTPKNTSFHPQQLWYDTNNKIINAHGGGILHYKGLYYWVGEDKVEHTSKALTGIHLYVSKDLYNWDDKGIILKVDPEGSHTNLESGCIIERPKLVYNSKTNKFVLWFHLELKGKGYVAAHFGVATSDSIDGPYKLIYDARSCPGKWPLNWSNEDQEKAKKYLKNQLPRESNKEWINKNGFLIRDFEGGQMSRDMTVYIDDDGQAYHIFASEGNKTLHIARLKDDYVHETGEYIRTLVGRSNEAPSIFKHHNKYWMITSGCTGWTANKARLAVADSIMGEWKELPNPFIDTKDANGKNTKTPSADKTFGTQSTFIFKIEGTNQFIFMADEWHPKNQVDSRYIWLPIQFKNGVPFLTWKNDWHY